MALRRRSLVAAWAATTFAALGAVGFSADVAAKMSDKDKEKARSSVRSASKETLAALYKVQPEARKVVEGAAGYATFSNFGVKILVAGSGSGKGVAVNKASGAETFMKMIEVQAGVGIGVKKFRAVWVFANEAALNQFVNSGWDASAQTTASAKAGGKGDAYQGAVSVASGVWLYQITDTGLAVEMTAKGTKYYKDDELN